MKKVNFAFTLAETMIVLVVLGVIATLTVPALIQKHTESANRTKIKKAMSVYDTALNKMVIENGIKDNKALYEDANSFAPENDCTNTAPYFKVSTVLNNNICTFKAPDGLFWDISKINAPILAFNEADLNNENAKNRYQLVGHFDNNGSLRVDDLAFETGGTNEAALTKVYNFINNIKEDTEQTSTTCDAECIFSTKNACENATAGYGSGVCANCRDCIYNPGPGPSNISYYDKDGNIKILKSGCNSDKSECYSTDTFTYTNEADGTRSEKISSCSDYGCSYFNIKYDANHNYIASLYDCSGNFDKCAYCNGNCEQYKHTETEQKTGQRWVSTGGSSGSGSGSGSGWCSGSGCGHWEEYTYEEVSQTYYK